MKPVAGQDISKVYAATPRDDDVQPLSTLAAPSEDQRAEHFAFTSEDQELLDKVLANNGHA